VHWFTARRVGEAVYGYKTLVEEDSGHVLGAHLVGPHADEVINVFGLAIRHNLTADDLKATMFAYPTGAISAPCFRKNHDPSSPSD
jgi:glutathione reductase (NADPH)